MKKLSKVLVLVLSAIMVLAMSASVFAAATADSGKGGSASITITLPTDNAGTDEEITYTVYKVFDATNNGTSSAISYKIDSTNGELSEDMIAAGFSVDTAGNVRGPASLDEDAISAIAAYATDSIGTFTAKPSDKTLTITGLKYGYYYITTTTGSVVTVDSTNPNADVEDKNTIPGPPDKKIVDGDDFIGSLDEAGQNALAQVGSTVYFEVTITKVKGATNYVFHDVMDAGLQYNNDVAVTPAAVVDNTTTASGDTVTVSFKNDELAKLADGTDITITYSATVTSDALTTDPANNTATLDYGDGHTTEMDQVSVYNATFTVTKNQPAKEGEEGAVLNEKDGKYYKPLAGAGFVVKNADNKYYKYTAATATASAKIEWVDSIDDATENFSTANGSVPAFNGLADGSYTLIEKTVPAGYNKAADVPFTVAEGNYTAANLAQTATVTNNGGTELPSTGGIGTTIFYVLGSLLVVGCGIVLISRKRMQDK